MHAAAPAPRLAACARALLRRRVRIAAPPPHVPAYAAASSRRTHAPAASPSPAAAPSAAAALPQLDGRYDYADVAVPRAPSIVDGVWTETDALLVEAAARDGGDGAAAAALGLGGMPAAAPAEAEPIFLLGMSEDALVALAQADGQPAYRGRQLHAALYSKTRPPARVEDIVAVPAAWRAALVARGVTLGRADVHAVAAAPDGTTKLLLRLGDGRVVETVGIPSDDSTHKRLTVCVSSQVGCPMRCNFCATGKGGFARNLRPHEIVDQVLQVEQHFGKRATHVVFMGMGEPMLNLRGVLAAQRSLAADVGIGARGMTISTVGVPNTLPRLAAAELQCTLAVSLHAPNQALREQLIPSAKAFPLSALLEDCAAYQRTTGRRVSFEYTLLGQVNDTPAHARELAQVLTRYRLAGHVNLIPYNPVDGALYERPSGNAAQAFARALRAAGVGASVRQTRGLEAAAACGMLRNAFQSRAGPTAPVSPLAAPATV